ncbi:MAG: preprotein translocase subunit SecE [Bacteroidia bacterium]|nr:preprotein translocase subunit SecE [Bacteroidia bacterium]
MEKFRHYLSDIYQELAHKVTWPTWSELQSSSIVVMVTSLIISLLIFVMDSSFSWILDKFYQMF